MLLKALPLQLIHLRGALILKRGCTEVSIEGENAGSVVQLMLDRLTSGPCSADDLAGIFPPGDRTAIHDLIAYLYDRRLLVESSDQGAPAAGAGSEGDGGNHVFFWHFGQTPSRVAAALNSQSIAVVGVNRVTRSLVRTLVEAGVENIDVIDYIPLRNLLLFEGLVPQDRWPDHLPEIGSFDIENTAGVFRGAGCIVAASDFGGWHLLEQWNRRSVARGTHFLPVMLENLIGWIGPMVIPGRTACLSCLRARIDSNLSDPQLRRVINAAAEDGKSIGGGHSAIADMLGILAASELLRFYNMLPGWQVGRAIELNVMTTHMTPHRVLRVPRCPACSTLNRYAALDTQRRAPLANVVMEPA